MLAAEGRTAQSACLLLVNDAAPMLGISYHGGKNTTAYDSTKDVFLWLLHPEGAKKLGTLSVFCFRWNW